MINSLPCNCADTRPLCVVSWNGIYIRTSSERRQPSWLNSGKFCSVDLIPFNITFAIGFQVMPPFYSECVLNSLFVPKIIMVPPGSLDSSLDSSLFGSPERTPNSYSKIPTRFTPHCLISLISFFHISSGFQPVLTISQSLFTPLPNCLKMSHLRR